MEDIEDRASVIAFSLSRFAQWQIKRRGGQLWIWLMPMGHSETGLIRASTSKPSGIEFEGSQHDRIVLWVAPDFPIDEFRVGWTPFTGFDVTWAGTPNSPGGG